MIFSADWLANRARPLIFRGEVHRFSEKRRWHFALTAVAPLDLSAIEVVKHVFNQITLTQTQRQPVFLSAYSTARRSRSELKTLFPRFLLLPTYTPKTIPTSSPILDYFLAGNCSLSGNKCPTVPASARFPCPYRVPFQTDWHILHTFVFSPPGVNKQFAL